MNPYKSDHKNLFDHILKREKAKNNRKSMNMLSEKLHHKNKSIDKSLITNNQKKYYVVNIPTRKLLQEDFDFWVSISIFIFYIDSFIVSQDSLIRYLG